MTAAIVALSNHQLDLGDDPDDGMRRRIVVDKMPLKFVPVESIKADSPATWQPQDASIKRRAREGVFCPEMVYVLQSMFKTLFVRGGSNITPVPRDVEQEGLDVCAPVAGLSKTEAVTKWLREYCEPVRSQDATSQTKVHEAMDATGLSFSKAERPSVLLEVGLRKTSDGRGLNFYSWNFAGSWQPVGVKA